MPVAGTAFAPASLAGVPVGTTAPKVIASFERKSGSRCASLIVTVPAASLVMTPFDRSHVAGVLTQAAAPGDRAIDAGRGPVHLELALERPAEVLRGHGRAVREADALVQRELPGQPVGGDLGQCGREIRNDLVAREPVAALEPDEAVVGQPQEDDVLVVVDARVDRRADRAPERGQRPSLMRGPCGCVSSGRGGGTAGAQRGRAPAAPRRTTLREASASRVFLPDRVESQARRSVQPARRGREPYNTRSRRKSIV